MCVCVRERWKKIEGVGGKRRKSKTIWNWENIRNHAAIFSPLVLQIMHRCIIHTRVREHRELLLSNSRHQWETEGSFWKTKIFDFKISHVKQNQLLKKPKTKQKLATFDLKKKREDNKTLIKREGRGMENKIQNSEPEEEKNQQSTWMMWRKRRHIDSFLLLLFCFFDPSCSPPRTNVTAFMTWWLAHFNGTNGVVWN